ncbi:c-type cytochrome [Eoetvoesiella caeni]|uniref:Cytochrome c553 n=1 Tax=Eoetvoesiella caeni TaxID=645616 RepID=A0A366H444_9BURK|nr:cytochrome c [Eoetvoesiella caeni]MCI2810482.1 cytochrome c [Eoetvoesiella caeni]NYT54846.1 cytochrome c [Eoetvoesiella caeni]RBP36760.1 cytochrome c553 [Eoetvoesiella caeni]
MKKLTLALAASLFVATGSAASAADLAAGQAAYQKYTCASCHGADAKSPIMPAYPILAGQHADYLAHALKTYKRGQAGAPATSNIRKNAVMGAMAMQLSDDDVANIAAWLASLPTPLSVR